MAPDFDRFRKMLKSAEKYFGHFLTWPLSAGPFCGLLRISLHLSHRCFSDIAVVSRCNPLNSAYRNFLRRGWQGGSQLQLQYMQLHLIFLIYECNATSPAGKGSYGSTRFQEGFLELKGGKRPPPPRFQPFQENGPFYKGAFRPY